MSEIHSEGRKAGRKEIVCFVVGGYDFCIDISQVLEIRGWTKTTKLPHAPDYILGMINLRGTVLPVIDLAVRMGFDQTQPGNRHVIVITQVEQKKVGVLVDAVSDIIRIDDTNMQPTPEISSKRTQEFLRGVHTVGDKIIRAIDMGQISLR